MQVFESSLESQPGPQSRLEPSLYQRPTPAPHAVSATDPRYTIHSSSYRCRHRSRPSSLRLSRFILILYPTSVRGLQIPRIPGSHRSPYEYICKPAISGTRCRARDHVRAGPRACKFACRKSRWLSGIDTPAVLLVLRLRFAFRPSTVRVSRVSLCTSGFSDSRCLGYVWHLASGSSDPSPALLGLFPIGSSLAGYVRLGLSDPLSVLGVCTSRWHRPSGVRDRRRRQALRP
ncbi:hypothetical protein OH76DRAFT_1189827 [Lentinus brumalis]|uniref:Uncharacterized protein n=1 Tax=Lentinus brumalis TaxID=2498619 RepID=A0A371CTH9_9APHY|nr:hypothetical protein OH76DRAFT_1189827 [Polyporus brumalis]